jgi:uncharacterized protein
MSLLSRISSDYIAAYKAKDQTRLDVLRMLKTAVTVQEKKQKGVLSDDEVLQVLLKEAKQRQDSIQEYSRAGRTDLADKEQAELAILRDYLPRQLSQEEQERAVDEAISQTGATSMKEMGVVIQTVMQAFKGQVDGKAVSQLVRSKLQS